MAKKMSNFEKKFALERSKGSKVFDFGGKKYNTKLAKGGVGIAGSNKGKAPKSDMNSGPAKMVTGPSRAGAISGMAKSKPSFSGISDVAFKTKKAPLKDIGNQKISRPVTSPTTRGKGSVQTKPKGDNSFSGNFKGAAKGLKKFMGY